LRLIPYEKSRGYASPDLSKDIQRGSRDRQGVIIQEVIQNAKRILAKKYHRKLDVLDEYAADAWMNLDRRYSEYGWKTTMSYTDYLQQYLPTELDKLCGRKCDKEGRESVLSPEGLTEIVDSRGSLAPLVSPLEEEEVMEQRLKELSHSLSPSERRVVEAGREVLKGGSERQGFYRRIGEVVGKSEKAVKQIMLRIRKKSAKKIGK
jgi:hypothetical protein